MSILHVGPEECERPHEGLGAKQWLREPHPFSDNEIFRATESGLLWAGVSAGSGPPKGDRVWRAVTPTFAVWAEKPEHDRLVVSASFVDALFYVEPGVSLGKPYVRHHFEKIGDLGFPCDSWEAMRDVMLSVVKELPRERYW